MLNFRTFLTCWQMALESNGGIGLVPSPDSAEPTSSQGAPLTALVPTMDVPWPTVTKRATIVSITGNAGQTGERRLSMPTNPILIHLDDGTRLFMSYDQFNHIKGDTPEAGKSLIVVMQRHPADKSGIPSQIQSVECH